MTTRASLSTPIAILLGSGVIAVGLVVGLGRMQPPAAPMPEVAAPPALEARPVTPPEVVARHAREAMAYQDAELRRRCPPPTPGRHEFKFDVSFDADGVEVMRGMLSDRRNPRSDLADCLSRELQPLRVPPPGAVTRVELPITLGAGDFAEGAR